MLQYSIGLFGFSCRLCGSSHAVFNALRLIMAGRQMMEKSRPTNKSSTYWYLEKCKLIRSILNAPLSKVKIEHYKGPASIARRRHLTSNIWHAWTCQKMMLICISLCSKDSSDAWKPICCSEQGFFIISKWGTWALLPRSFATVKNLLKLLHILCLAIGRINHEKVKIDWLGY